MQRKWGSSLDPALEVGSIHTPLLPNAVGTLPSSCRARCGIRTGAMSASGVATGAPAHCLGAGRLWLLAVAVEA